MNAELDPLLNPYRADLAAASLEGQVRAERFVEPRRLQVVAATAPVHGAPRGDAEMISEALHGEHVDVYEEADGWAWGQLSADGYVGYLPAAALTQAPLEPTHRVCVPRTFVYPRAHIKAPPAGTLTLNARVTVDDEDEEFFRTASGTCLFKSHLSAIGSTAPDFVAVAERFLGTPYLWGGKSVGGIDCSGLVQVACEAAGIACLRDSYMQRDTLGTALPNTGLADLKRGDLLFWKGHVGIMADRETLLHATAHSMLTVLEPVDEVVRRIADMGTELTRIRRI